MKSKTSPKRLCGKPCCWSQTRQKLLTQMETREMTAIPVELPEDLQEFVEATVQRGQFANANEYIVALVAAARSQRSEIEAALVEGLRSGPAEEWTSQEWADIKQRVIERHQEG